MVRVQLLFLMFSQVPGSTIAQQNWFDEALVQLESDVNFELALS